MKKLFSILLSLALLLGLCACTAGEPTPSASGQTDPTEPAGEPSSPLLYKVTDGEGHTIYLFGSIHMGIESMYPLPDYVLDAFDSADVLAVERDDSDAEEQAVISNLWKLPEGTTITDYVSEDTYQAALKILQEKGVYEEGAEHCKPVLWSNAINSLAIEKSPADETLGVDLHLQQRANQSGKVVEGIESVEAHYRVMSDLSMELQCLLLEQAVESYWAASTGVAMNMQCKAWAAGEEAYWAGASVENILANVDETVLPLMQEYYKTLQTDRDLLMTQYAKDALASGKTVFICVGISHVVPKGAMIDQLTEAGYTVTRVTG